MPALKVPPPWIHKELGSVREVESSNHEGMEHTVLWAWANRGKGVVRARTFAPDWGIPEDEANASGSMQLASRLGRELEIRHGKGSVIYAKPVGKNMAEVGGKVAQD